MDLQPQISGISPTGIMNSIIYCAIHFNNFFIIYILVQSRELGLNEQFAHGVGDAV